MKKTILTLLAGFAGLLLLLALLAPSLLGFSITQLGSAVRVATGMGAKLACSGYFVSGFSEARNLDDLASYSPANQLLDLHYDNQGKRVTATLFGLGETTATFRPGLGCTLDVGDTRALDQVVAAPLASTAGDWPTGENPAHIDPALQRTLDSILAEDNRAGLNTRALVVVQNGQLVAESYGAQVTPQTPLLGWSMGKSLTAMMLGRLQALQPELEITTPLFPQWRDERQQVSLENLLQMSSGLDFDETYAPGSDATRMLFNAHSASEIALQSQLAHSPGTHFSYSSGTTNLLARWIYEQLGGNPQSNVDFFRQQILAPLGMQHTTFEVDASGVFVGSSYIYASARDWARLGLLMLQDGKWNSEQLLPEGWVTAASSPNGSSNDSGYGYQFWLNDAGESLRYPELPQDSYFMLGNRKQAVMISPSTDTVIVRLGWSSGDYPTGRNFAQLLP
ncbi:serine hydrolase [Microbulbifer sp. YPW1]|uniref:serine hydrolase domain-containing protein n=1 Tax=Microbulbifer sp. YPW1 TaxID=2745199 RepID=UPI0015984A3F|nr:serine hydrolase [Microbulbifer sp. YPW1]QKX15585.1 serine hydrolase [Microbulbifer sp. YPW1]